MAMSKYWFLLGILLLTFFGCPADDDEMMMVVIDPPPPPPPTLVSFDLDSVPYTKLSDYHFFTGDNLADMVPNEGLLLYEPISALFSDYAHKLRYVWFPDGTKASYAGDHEVLDFPDGSVIIKTFYYDNVQPANTRRIIETRLLYKKAGAWEFADYTWNNAQDEATFSLTGSNTPVTFIDEDGTQRSVDYRIPSESECLTCHKKFGDATPIGPKPQNLNSALDYADGNPMMNQLVKWQSVDYLGEGVDIGNISTVVDWEDETQELALRVRAYLDMNCSSCHREGGHCDYRPIRLAYSETELPINLGICVTPEEFINPAQINIITPGIPDKSALYYRINSIEPMSRMPLLGRTVVHEDAVAMIGQWITGLTSCD